MRSDINKGIWETLESNIRTYAQNQNLDEHIFELKITTGGYEISSFLDQVNQIVPIPTYLWKEVKTVDENGHEIEITTFVTRNDRNGIDDDFCNSDCGVVANRIRVPQGFLCCSMEDLIQRHPDFMT